MQQVNFTPAHCKIKNNDFKISKIFEFPAECLITYLLPSITAFSKSLYRSKLGFLVQNLDTINQKIGKLS